MASGAELRTLQGHSRSANAVALMTDGRLAVSASYDNTLKVWDVASGAVLRTLQGHSGPVNGVAVSGDGRRVVSASDDHTLKIWNLKTGDIIAGFTTEGAALCCAFAAPDKIIAGDAGGRLYLLRLEM